MPALRHESCSQPPGLNVALKPAETLCPLCGKANDCQVCSFGAYKGSCWCASLELNEALLARVPKDLSVKACICRNCIEQAASQTVDVSEKRALAVSDRGCLPGDFYFEGDATVFTEQYHLRRGRCCGSGCRHCPYPKPTQL